MFEDEYKCVAPTKGVKGSSDMIEKPARAEMFSVCVCVCVCACLYEDVFVSITLP